MSDTGRWARLEGIVDVARLHGAGAVVIGLGSGGSTVAVELARAGIGHLVLVDPDRLELPNVLRHECDDRYLGATKVAAVADLIAHRHPGAEVEAIEADVFDVGPALVGAIRGADVVAVCTDTEPPKHFLNRMCVAAGVPAVYGGVYRAGMGGEIVPCGGGADDPCYACVASVLERAVPDAAVHDGDLDYGVVGADGSLQQAPGLGMDVRIVALIHARTCLQTITGNEVGRSPVVLFGLEAVEGLFPRRYASALIDVAPRDDCLVCRPFRAGPLADGGVT